MSKPNAKPAAKPAPVKIKDAVAATAKGDYVKPKVVKSHESYMEMLRKDTDARAEVKYAESLVPPVVAEDEEANGDESKVGE